MAHEPQRVSFKNKSLDLAEELHLPDGFDPDRKCAALVISTPDSNVKERIGAFYGGRISDRGFMTLAFDPSY